MIAQPARSGPKRKRPRDPNAIDRALERLLQRSNLVWLAPLFVAFIYYEFSLKYVEYGIGGCIAIMLLAVFVQRPGPALVALGIFLPIYQVLFGILLGLHVPSSILRSASSFKELLAVCVLIAALKELRDGRARLDRIDKAALTYVAAATIYLIVPHIFSAQDPAGWSVRLLAWRSDCAYVLIFFGARHAPISAKWRDRFFRTILAMGTLTVVCALYQRLRPSSWLHFMLHRANQEGYLERVLHQSPAQVSGNLRYLLSLHPLHVASIFISPYDMADYLLLVAALVMERVSRDRTSIPNYTLFAAVVATLFFSQERSDALALLIILLVVVLPAPRRPTEARLRMILAILVGAALIVPSLGGTRFTGGTRADTSSKNHIGEVERGVSYIVEYPFGLGIGLNAATVNQLPGAAGGATLITTDNSVTQVGDELGLQAVIPWLLFVGFVLYEWRKRSKHGDVWTAAAGLGLLGILIAGMYHQVFLEYPVPWTLWAAVGLGLQGTRVGGAETYPDAVRDQAPL